jgi:uncharacterized protein YjdB
MRHDLATPLLVALALAAALPAAAAAQRRARESAPSGAEIASKAKTARLDQANAVTGEFQGKKITFTPAVLAPRTDLGIGQVIGVLENEVAGDETGLPPGRYSVMAAQLPDGWHVYAESGGRIVKEAVGVRLEKRAEGAADTRPRFRAKGWGYDIDYGGDIIYDPPPVATVTVTPTPVTMFVGETRQFFAALRDSRGNLLTRRSITWTSSNSAVAVSGAGVATTSAPGTATVTATSEGKSGSATVTVPVPEYRVYVGGYTALYLGQARVYSASVYVGYYYGSPTLDPNQIVWTSSNSAVATVTPLMNGTGRATVTPVAEGTVTITAAYRTPYRTIPGSMTVPVTQAPVASVGIEPASVSVVAGQSAQLAATVRDATGAVVSGAAVTWTSGTPAVAEVTVNGRVIALTPGSTTVTATTAGVSGTAAVAVTPVPVSTVTVTPSSVTVSVDQTTTLTAALRDAAGNELTGRSVVWTTSEPAIADVTASGLVVGVYGGIATITATSEGKSGTAQVSVPAKSSPDPAPTTTTLSFNW